MSSIKKLYPKFHQDQTQYAPRKPFPISFKEESIAPRISRQHRSFLLLELMIALFLVGTFALPLARFPMQAVQEEFKSAYRMQTQRLADIAFAEFTEKLYCQEISWKEITSSRGAKAVVLDDAVELSFGPLGKKKFSRHGTLHSFGKKGQDSGEWRLATFCVKITAQQKGFKLFRTKKSVREFRNFTYQVLINKSPAPIATPTQPEVTPKVIQK